jgi:hypothetical protein
LLWRIAYEGLLEKRCRKPQGRFLGNASRLSDVSSTTEKARLVASTRLMLGTSISFSLGLLFPFSFTHSLIPLSDLCRATNFYVALYWADFLQQEDPTYKPIFGLSKNRGKIVEEFTNSQEKRSSRRMLPVDATRNRHYESIPEDPQFNPPAKFGKV